MANPGFVPPMLAKLVKALPEGPEWAPTSLVYEAWLKLAGQQLSSFAREFRVLEKESWCHAMHERQKRPS
jgi:hypothetical protein